MSDYTVSILSRIGIEAFVALSTYLLLLMGRVSFGQQAFFALGAYGAGMATALYGAPLAVGLLAGCVVAALGAALLGLALARAAGLAFAVGSLAFAELVRFALLAFHFQRPVGEDLVGPIGAEGFRGIRLIYVSGIGTAGFLGIVSLLLLVTVVALIWFERSRGSAMLRMIGEDPVAAAVVGIRVQRVTWAGVAGAGALAGLGGGLFAHWGTYVEPGHAEVMLGVHSLAYGIIGGLGTPLGPILGVALDIGVLESFRPLRGYRMIIFGGLVAAFLVLRPRGVLDERTVHALRGRLRRRRAG